MDISPTPALPELPNREEWERVNAAYQDELRLRFSSRELIATILDGAPQEEIADCLTGMVASRFREPRVALFVRDEFNVWQPLSLRELSLEFGEAAARLAARSDVLLKRSASGTPLRIENPSEQAEFSPELRTLFECEHICSLLIGWITSPERVLGALVLYPSQPREWTPAEMSAFQGLTELGSIGLAFATLLAKQRDVAVIEERSRLAREMHDTVAQSLAALLMQLENTQTLLGLNDLPTAKSVLIQARLQARRALEDTRRAVQNLSALEAETRTAAQMLEEEVTKFQQTTEIPSAFILSGEQRKLTQEIRLTLLRLAQEALSNARKHAEAARVRVGLQFAAEKVILLVEDDGAGFDTEAAILATADGGYGLFGMEERARLAGGTLEIDSSPGWGTRIRATLPYPSTGTNAPLPTAISPSHSAPRPLETTAASVIRVLIVDDRALARQGIRALLGTYPGIAIQGEATNGREALTMAEQEMPDAVLMDLQMPEMGGIEAMKRLHELKPDLPVVILTSQADDSTVREALQAGACGFLLKDADGAEIVAALVAAVRGEVLLAPAIRERLANLTRAPEKPADLTERDLELLRGLGQGLRNKELAERLFVTTSTVEYHLSNLFVKLGVSNRAEAVRAAAERHLI